MRTLTFLLLCLMQTLVACGQRKNLILEHTFDKEIGEWYARDVYHSYALGVTDYTKRQGKSLKVELRKGQGIRAELGTWPKEALKESWYGFSLFFPASFADDKGPESIVQWQAHPDPGEAWRSAPMFLGVMNRRLILDQRTDTLAISNANSLTFNRTDLGILQKSKWLDFVVHAKWSHKNDGLIEIWRNDKLVYSQKGPNCYNDQLYPYFKVGIYKWDFPESAIGRRIIYVDEVRIGNEKATYNDVYPGRKVVKTVKHYNDGTSETNH